MYKPEDSGKVHEVVFKLVFTCFSLNQFICIFAFLYFTKKCIGLH